MHSIIRFALVVALVSQTVSASVQDAASATWRVSTGRTQDASGAWTALRSTPTLRAELEDELSDLLVRADVTRDWATAGERLTFWSAVSTWSGATDRESLLELLALRKVEFYERLGRTREALAAVEGVLVPADARGITGVELKSATPDDLALQERVLAKPKVAAHRERLRSALAAQNDDDEVGKIVIKAVQIGDRDQIQQLGRRAVAPLRSLAAQSASTWVEEQRDPLAMLAAIDEAAAAELILEHFDSGGTFWRRRALRAMKNENVLSNPGTFGLLNGRNALLEPWWSTVAVRFLQEPETAVDVLPVVAQLAYGGVLNGGLDARFADALTTALRSDDDALASGTKQIVTGIRSREEVRPVLDPLLDSPVASERAYAAEILRSFDDQTGLRAHAKSDDPVVRAAVATGYRAIASGGELADPASMAAFEAFLVDTDVRVREAASATLQSATAADRTPISRRAWDALVADASPIVRANAAATAARRPENLADLERLLADPDVRVRVAGLKGLAEKAPALSASTWTALSKDSAPGVRRLLAPLVVRTPSIAEHTQALFLDPDPETRPSLLSLLSMPAARLSADTWAKLARDPDRAARSTVASEVWRTPTEVAAPVLAVLAADVDGSVLQGAGNALVRLLSGSDQNVDVDAYLPAIRTMLANVRVDPRFFQKRNLYPVLTKTHAGRALLGEIALGDDASARQALADHLIRHVDQLSTVPPHERELAHVPYDDAQLVRYLAALAKDDGDRAERLVGVARDLRIVDVAPWRAFAHDATRPLWLRLHAFAVVLRSGDDTVTDDLVRALTPSTVVYEGALRDAVRRVFDVLSPDSARAVFERVVDAPTTTVVTGLVADAEARRHGLTSAGADAVLGAHLADPPRWRGREAADVALREVASRPFEAQGDWFARAALDDSLVQQTITILAEMREPRYRSILIGIVESKLGAGSSRDVAVNIQARKSAVGAIGRYLDDESVDFLLDFAGRTGPGDLRDLCYAELARIQTHREQRAQWEQRKRAGASKDAAILAIVKVLESGDGAARVQAVRSLATLGAVEELPRLIALLADRDAAVRDAAQRALDVLNASTAPR